LRQVLVRRGKVALPSAPAQVQIRASTSAHIPQTKTDIEILPTAPPSSRPTLQFSPLTAVLDSSSDSKASQAVDVTATAIETARVPVLFRSVVSGNGARARVPLNTPVEAGGEFSVLLQESL